MAVFGRPSHWSGATIGLVAFVALVTVVPSSAFAVTLPTHSATVAWPSPSPSRHLPAIVVPSTPAFNWPEFHDNPQLLGVAANSPIATSNASKLGVGWDTNLYGSALDSPAVAYDPNLNETLAYIGTEAGDFLAVNVATGQIVWGVWLGSIIRSSPLVYNDSVYVATFTDPAVLRLNATTGATQARIISPDPVEATPTLATPPGGVATLYIPTLNTGPKSAPLLALNAKTLSVEWEFDKYNKTAGSWASTSFAVNATGVPVVIFGTDNPDTSIYTIDALTGQLLWRFQCDNPDNGDWDVASGPVISLPGGNGFTDGVVYAINKISIAYALDLTTGKLIWETNFRALAGLGLSSGVSRSTAALDGTNLVFGFEQGLFDLNATNGKEIWMYQDPTDTESIASPAIAGGGGRSVVVTGDVGGDLDVVSLAKGLPLYTYPTGAYITASPAVVDGNILIASSNGFLYDFVVGGGTASVLPSTSIGFPLQGENLTNPDGDLRVAGNASDPTAVAAVRVAIEEDGTGGPWWDAATRSWSPGPIDSNATLSSPGANLTSWSLNFPVPKAGATFEVTANAVSVSGQSDLVGAQVDFSVAYATVGPHLEATPAFVAPGGKVTVSGGGFGSSVSVTLTLEDSVVATLTSNAHGDIGPKAIVISKKAPFGLASITAVGKNSSDASSAAITITNSWDQTGEDPGHEGYEPNDVVLNNLVFPGNNTWVKLAWYFASGVAINASPAIADGVAYVADTEGQIIAIDTHNGGLLWSATLASGAAIEGSPAVDPALGLLFVGANDGTLTALSTATGAVNWSTSIGGDVWAPVDANGKLFVTSSLGTVAAVTEATGKVTWARSLGSGIDAAPSLNPTTDLLVVSEMDGSVTALDATNGSSVWTYATAGAIQDSAVLAYGEVFVGSDDGDEYAINQTTATLTWSYDAGAAIEASAALIPDHSIRPYALVLGTADGYVDELHGSTGKLAFDVHPGSEIVGVAGVDGILFFETAAGEVGSVRAYVSTNAIFWHRLTDAGLASSPVILDGAIYVTGQDGNLYAWDTNGQPPA